jgi:uncharacterized DUF497 family protein
MASCAYVPWRRRDSHGQAKNLANREKHSVGFTEVRDAYLDLHRLISGDGAHRGRQRAILRVGMVRWRVMAVRFAWRV